MSLVQCGGGIAEGVACFVFQTTSADIPFEARAVAVSRSVPFILLHLWSAHVRFRSGLRAVRLAISPLQCSWCTSYVLLEWVRTRRAHVCAQLTKRRSGIQRTDNMVNKLITVVVETGLASGEFQFSRSMGRLANSGGQRWQPSCSSACISSSGTRRTT